MVTALMCTQDDRLALVVLAGIQHSMECSSRQRHPETDRKAMAHEPEAPTLEWWPDYGGDLLWSRTGQGGHRVTMAEVGLSGSFQERAASWLGSYDDAKLPIDGDGDADWLAEGVRLLEDARAELAGQYVVQVTEPYWAT